MFTKLKLIAAMMIATFALVACEPDGPAERAGEALDEAGDSVRDAADDVRNDIEDVCEEASGENC